MIGQPGFDIHTHGHRMVRRAVVLDGELCDAIMEVAMGSQRAWCLQEIKALNDQLENCEMSVSEWLTNL